MVADYSIGQMMWIRYGVFCVFACCSCAARVAGDGTQPKAMAAGRPLDPSRAPFFVLAFAHLPLADTPRLAATSPLIVIVLGVVFLGERAGPARWFAVATGFSRHAADRPSLACARSIGRCCCR